MKEVEEDEANHNHGVAAVRHIKKRALRNKSLSISFDDKDLRNYITGFHKRKKKRRKEAEKQLQEKERLKRIDERKKRKLAKEIALYGGSLPAENPVTGSGECVDEPEEDEGNIPITSISGMKTYESGETTITVTTSVLTCKDEEERTESVIPQRRSMAEKNKPLVVSKRGRALKKKKGLLKKVTKKSQRKQKGKQRGYEKEERRT